MKSISERLRKDVWNKVVLKVDEQYPNHPDRMRIIIKSFFTKLNGEYLEKRIGEYRVLLYTKIDDGRIILRIRSRNDSMWIQEFFDSIGFCPLEEFERRLEVRMQQLLYEESTRVTLAIAQIDPKIWEMAARQIISEFERTYREARELFTIDDIQKLPKMISESIKGFNAPQTAAGGSPHFTEEVANALSHILFWEVVNEKRVIYYERNGSKLEKSYLYLISSIKSEMGIGTNIMLFSLYASHFNLNAALLNNDRRYIGNEDGPVITTMDDPIILVKLLRDWSHTRVKKETAPKPLVTAVKGKPSLLIGTLPCTDFREEEFEAIIHKSQRVKEFVSEQELKSNTQLDIILTDGDKTHQFLSRGFRFVKLSADFDGACVLIELPSEFQGKKLRVSIKEKFNLNGVEFYNTEGDGVVYEVVIQKNFGEERLRQILAEYDQRIDKDPENAIEILEETARTMSEEYNVQFSFEDLQKVYDEKKGESIDAMNSVSKSDPDLQNALKGEILARIPPFVECFKFLSLLGLSTQEKELEEKISREMVSLEKLAEEIAEKYSGLSLLLERWKRSIDGRVYSVSPDLLRQYERKRISLEDIHSMFNNDKQKAISVINDTLRIRRLTFQQKELEIENIGTYTFEGMHGILSMLVDFMCEPYVVFFNVLPPTPDSEQTMRNAMKEKMIKEIKELKEHEIPSKLEALDPPLDRA